MATKKKKPGSKRRKAAKIVDGQINRAIRELDADREDMGQDIRRHGLIVRNTYDRGNKDLDHVYGETKDFIGHQQGAIDARYNDNKNLQSAAQANLRSQLDSNFQNSYSGINDEAARLGISGSVNNMGLISNNENARNLADLQNASQATTLNLMNSGSSDIGNLIAGMNQGSYMSSKGQNLNRRNDDLAALRQQRNDELDKIRRSKRNTRASRGDLILQVLQALK